MRLVITWSDLVQFQLVVVMIYKFGFLYFNTPLRMCSSPPLSHLWRRRNVHQWQETRCLEGKHLSPASRSEKNTTTRHRGVGLPSSVFDSVMTRTLEMILKSTVLLHTWFLIDIYFFLKYKFYGVMFVFPSVSTFYVLNILITPFAYKLYKYYY